SSKRGWYFSHLATISSILIPLTGPIGGNKSIAFNFSSSGTFVGLTSLLYICFNLFLFKKSIKLSKFVACTFSGDLKSAFSISSLICVCSLISLYHKLVKL